MIENINNSDTFKKHVNKLSKSQKTSDTKKARLINNTNILNTLILSPQKSVANKTVKIGMQKLMAVASFGPNEFKAVTQDNNPATLKMARMAYDLKSVHRSNFLFLKYTIGNNTNTAIKLTNKNTTNNAICSVAFINNRDIMQKELRFKILNKAPKV